MCEAQGEDREPEPCSGENREVRIGDRELGNSSEDFCCKGKRNTRKQDRERTLVLIRKVAVSYWKPCYWREWGGEGGM